MLESQKNIAPAYTNLCHLSPSLFSFSRCGFISVEHATQSWYILPMMNIPDHVVVGVIAGIGSISCYVHNRILHASYMEPLRNALSSCIVSHLSYDTPSLLLRTILPRPDHVSGLSDNSIEEYMPIRSSLSRTTCPWIDKHPDCAKQQCQPNLWKPKLNLYRNGWLCTWCDEQTTHR